eukprot:symbB.v1.2.027488.t1/scaffold2825.1/size69381/6
MERRLHVTVGSQQSSRSPGRKQKQKKYWLLQQLRKSGLNTQTTTTSLQIAQSLVHLQQSGLLTSTQDYTHAIRALGAVLWWKDALAVLHSRVQGQDQSFKDENSGLYNAAIVALETAPFRWQRALALWSQCAPEISVTNAVATALKGALLWERAFSLFVCSQDGGQLLDTVSHNILITSLSAPGCSWTRILLQLQALGLEYQDIVSLNSGLSTLGSKSKWPLGLLLMRDAPCQRVVLDEMATTAAIVAIQDSGSWPRTFNLLRSSKTRSSSKDLSIRSFNAAIAMTQKAAAWFQALQLFEKLLRTVKPSIVSLNSLLCMVAWPQDPERL